MPCLLTLKTFWPLSTFVVVFAFCTFLNYKLKEGHKMPSCLLGTWRIFPLAWVNLISIKNLWRKYKINESNYHNYYFLRSDQAWLDFSRKKRNNMEAVILFPLHPASLMHRNPQRYKLIYGMHCKDQSIDLNMYICRNIPFLWQLLWLLSNDAFFKPLVCFKIEGLF